MSYRVWRLSSFGDCLVECTLFEVEPCAPAPDRPVSFIFVRIGVFIYRLYRSAAIHIWEPLSPGSKAALMRLLVPRMYELKMKSELVGGKVMEGDNHS